LRTISPRWRSPRSTGSLAPARQSTDPRSKIEAWLATRGEHHDRADWAVVRAQDGTFLGEAVLNEVDLDNDSANYRVWLAGPHVFGQGYGTEITRLVVDYALGTCGLHPGEPSDPGSLGP
jgi:RimJ/RimL family protein N-acetyltransferase